MQILSFSFLILVILTSFWSSAVYPQTHLRLVHNTRLLHASGNREEPKPKTLLTLEQSLPLYEPHHNQNVIIGDIRGKYENKESYEGNLGVIYRQILYEHYAIGVYGYFDYMRLENRPFEQWTMGFDIFNTSGYGLRANYYAPYPTGFHIAHTTITQGQDENHNTISGELEEYNRVPLKGLEIELEKDMQTGFYRTQIVLGSFFFKDSISTVASCEKGVRLRAQITSLHHTHWLPSLQMQWEKTFYRESTLSLSLSIRSNTRHYNASSASKSLLLRPVYRDIDIRTEKKDAKKRSLESQKLPKVPTNTKGIPPYLFQTHYAPSQVPKHVRDEVLNKAQGYEYYLLDDDDIRLFLAQYYPDFSDTFEQLQGAHRADLARYLLLHRYGGVYFDIKAIPKKPLNEIFNRNQNIFYTALSHGWSEDWNWKSIHQSILASPPQNPILRKAADNIQDLVQGGQPWITSTNNEYDWVIEDLFRIIQSYAKNELKAGLNIIKESAIPNVYLFKESCSAKGKTAEGYTCNQADWRGSCCLIVDKDPIFLGRDPSYPW